LRPLRPGSSSWLTIYSVFPEDPYSTKPKQHKK
jgi:hypothetical protein